MPKLLGSQLDLPRCPHCNVDTPNLRFAGQAGTQTFDNRTRYWRMYACTRCAGIVTAESVGWDMEVTMMFPTPASVSADIPDRARTYLDQAINALSSPAGAVMLAASAVDAMLKHRGLTDGTLNSRIDKAAAQHLITSEMAAWAHDVRLDANDQRHSDTGAELPTTEQAQKCIEFATALGQFLFVLPARVERGRKNSKTVPPHQLTSR